MGQFGSLSEFRMALDNIVSSTSRSHRHNPGQMFDALAGAGFAGDGPDEGPDSPYYQYALKDLPDAELHNMAAMGDMEAAYELRRREQRKGHGGKRKKGRRRKKAGNNPRGTRSNRAPRKRRKSRKNTGFVPEGMQFVAPVAARSGDKTYKDPWARVGGSVGGTKKLRPGLTPDDKKQGARAARARGVGLLQHILEHLGFTKRDILRAHQWMENEGVLSYGEDRRLPDGTLVKGSGRRDRKSQRRALEILMGVKQGKNNPRSRRR